MAIMLALAAAALYGSADFVGGLASRKNHALVVALAAQAGGLILLILAVPLVGGSSAVVPADLMWGAAAGVTGGIGLVIGFRALARGPMSVAAPTTALSASAVPIIAGLLLGERPGGATLAGIAIALVAVVLITASPGGNGVEGRRSLLPTVTLSLTAGAVFGLFYVFLSQSGSGAGLWPLVAARAVSVPLLVALVFSRSVPWRLSRLQVGPMFASGILDMGANILFLFAARHGMLAVVAAITGLYPAGTIALAQARLGERLAPIQMGGLGVAALAAVMVTL